jgi:hypothetical protein
MNQEVMSPEVIAEQETLAREIAETSGENTRTYTVIPTITVYNPSKTQSDSSFEIGDFVKTTRTQQGYETEKYDKPFEGIIIKTRMFLKLKYKYAEGKPAIITNEFDSYSDDEPIFVKEKGLDKDAKFEEVFVGNYKQVNDKYSLKSDTEIEKKLDLHHAIYVLRDLDSLDVIRIDSKGLSRSNYFDYMNDFTRKGLDRMSTTWTIFNTEISNKDYKGKPRQAPIAAIKFSKKIQLTLEEMRKLKDIQVKFERQLLEKDKMFGNVKIGDVKEDEQPAPKDELPTIQIEEEAKLIPGEDELDESEVKIEDVPF